MFKPAGKSTVVAVPKSGGGGGGIHRLSKAEMLRKLMMSTMFDEKRCAEFYQKGIVPKLHQGVTITERNRHPRSLMYGAVVEWSFRELAQLPWCSRFWQFKRQQVRFDYHSAMIGNWMAEACVQHLIENM